MKKKDIIYLVVALLIFAVAGFLAYEALGSGGTSDQVIEVEVVQPVSAEFNAEAVEILEDDDRSRDFSVPVDLNNGLSNPTPFGSL